MRYYIRHYILFYYEHIIIGAGIIDDGRYNPTSNVSMFQNFTCTGTESFLSECIPNDGCISTCDIPYGIQCYGKYLYTCACV